MMEGIGCVLAGMWGSGTGTTSYSENIGAIGITKVSTITCDSSYITKPRRPHVTAYVTEARLQVTTFI